MAIEDIGELVVTAAYLGLLAREVGGETFLAQKARTEGSEAVAAHINIVVGERSAIVLLDAVTTGEDYTSFPNIQFSPFNVINFVILFKNRHVQSTIEDNRSFVDFVVA